MSGIVGILTGLFLGFWSGFFVAACFYLEGRDK